MLLRLLLQLQLLLLLQPQPQPQPQLLLLLQPQLQPQPQLPLPPRFLLPRQPARRGPSRANRLASSIRARSGSSGCTGRRRSCISDSMTGPGPSAPGTPTSPKGDRSRWRPATIGPCVSCGSAVMTRRAGSSSPSRTAGSVAIVSRKRRGCSKLSASDAPSTCVRRGQPTHAPGSLHRRWQRGLRVGASLGGVALCMLRVRPSGTQGVAPLHAE